MNQSPKSPQPITALKSGYTLGGWLPLAISLDGTLAPHLQSIGGLPSGPSVRIDEDKHLYWMHEALISAMAGVGLPSPNPNVGCVLVRDQQELARGGTARYGGLHGEAQALAQLSDPLAAGDATAYVTLEPCGHQGKQPPCAQALVQAGISQCVYAIEDPHPLVSGRGAQMLRTAGIEVLSGPLARESLAWNLPFFHQVSYNRPLVVGKWAQTLNGQLADQEGGSQWISGPLARRYVHWLRQKYDAIMVGAGTVLADGPDLTARDTWGPMRQPLKIIFDPSGRLAQIPFSALSEKVKNRTFARDSKIVLVFPENSAMRQWAASSVCDLFYVGVKQRDHAFEALLATLAGSEFRSWYGQTVQSIFVEGGPALHNHLLAIDAYDAFHVFVTPSFIAADRNRVGYFAPHKSPLGFAQVASMKRYVLMQTASLGQDILLEFLPPDRYARIFGSIKD